jgi:hypothetical protein
VSGRGWRLVTDRPWWMFLALLIAVGCGDDDDDRGRFGDLTALRVYRDTLNPIADAVSAIEIDVQQRAVGSSDVATAANLSAVYTDVRPLLLETLVDFDRLTPPDQLLDLHGQIRRLIVLRLDAYRLVMEGYADGDSTVYEAAELKLRMANDLIPEINLGLCEVDVALGDLDDCRLLALRQPIRIAPDPLTGGLSAPDRDIRTGAVAS